MRNFKEGNQLRDISKQILRLTDEDNKKEQIKQFNDYMSDNYEKQNNNKNSGQE